MDRTQKKERNGCCCCCCCLFSPKSIIQKKKEESVVLEKQNVTKSVKSLFVTDTQKKICGLDMDHSDREKAGIEKKRYDNKKKYLDLEHHSFFLKGNKSFGIG